MKRKSKFCETCPRRLNNLPNSQCPLALERISALQTLDEDGKKKRESESLPGCPWYITSIEHNYCFWNLVTSPDGKIDPFTDKEIGNILMLSPAQVDKAMVSAIAKLRANRNSPDMQELRELILEKIASQSDDTIYLPDEFNSIADAIALAENEEEIPEIPGEKKKKVQLYGLYSNKALERVRGKKDKKE